MRFILTGDKHATYTVEVCARHESCEYNIAFCISQDILTMELATTCPKGKKKHVVYDVVIELVVGRFLDSPVNSAQ